MMWYRCGADGQYSVMPHNESVNLVKVWTSSSPSYILLVAECNELAQLWGKVRSVFTVPCHPDQRKCFEDLLDPIPGTTLQA